jgi:hypothetical protein
MDVPQGTTHVWHANGRDHWCKGLVLNNRWHTPMAYIYDVRTRQWYKLRSRVTLEHLKALSERGPNV